METGESYQTAVVVENVVISGDGNNENDNNSVGKSPTPSEKTDKDAKPQLILKDTDELIRHLELMHDRCITRNLQAAGLGGLDANQEKLIYGHLDPNARMTTGECLLSAVVLHVKESERQFRYTTILLNEGADPNRQDKDGKTALMHACLLGMDKSAKAILHHATTDITKKDRMGNTALMYAAAAGNEKIVKLYIKSLRKFEKRVRKRTVSNSKSTPLDGDNGGDPSNNLAMYLFNDDILEEKNQLGFTAHDLALQNERYECAQLIEVEQSRRLKVLQQKLLTLSNKNRRSSMSVQTAKESLRRYQRTFGSFDGIFDNAFDDKSDDELVGVDKSTNFSRKRTQRFVSNPNLRGDYQPTATTDVVENDANSSQIANENGQTSAAPGLDKVPVWEEVFPRSRMITRPSSQYEDANKLGVEGTKEKLRKSLTESSLDSSTTATETTQNGQVMKKSSITQRLVNLLRRRNKNSPANGPEPTPLRKGVSQPELLRKISRESVNSATFPQRFVNAAEKQRKSVDLTVVRQGTPPNYSNLQQQSLNLQLAQNETSTTVAPLSNLLQIQKPPQLSFTFDSLLNESGSSTLSVVTPDDHNPLKPKSSLPAIQKKSMTNKQLPMFNESILDREIFNMPSSREQRGRSFDVGSFK